MKKVLLGILVLILLAGGYIAYKVIGPNTGDFSADAYLYIPTGSDYNQVKEILEREKFVKDMRSFDFVAKRAKYPNRIKPGKYKISKGMSNLALVKKLRSGDQEPVKLVINKIRTRQDFAKLIDKHLEPDSAEMLRLLHNPEFLKEYGLDSSTALCAIIPDTYEFWWNTSSNEVFDKLAGYYEKFWTDERKAKAAARGLNPVQTTILASIIDEETNYNPEKPEIASVYLNRLKIGMRLQADPTVKYAVGDFGIRRITSAITSTPSPYNTYYTAGLPPGPICTPSKKSIEAVLNAPETKYLYFSAKEDMSGAHRFASTYSEHLKNARLYHKALNQRGIH